MRKISSLKKARMTAAKNHKAPGWECASGWILSQSPDFGLMGIVNVTPDSFYDGGAIKDSAGLLKKTAGLLEQGADIIDIGAESTRPGAQPVPYGTEMARLEPALRLIRREFPKARLSVDTRKAKTARRSLELGADIINDVSGLGHDPGLLEILSEFKPAYVLVHSRGNAVNSPGRAVYGSLIDEMLLFFEKGLERLARAGLPENRVVLDPGIGFDKTSLHGLEIIRRLESFRAFGRPLLIGLSMKSLFLRMLCPGERARELGAAAASALCLKAGVFWHRVHDVRAVKAALAGKGL